MQLVAGPRVHAAETVELRGYGKVSAELTANRGVFTCESAEKADVLLGKLLADLFWDKSLNDVQSSVVVGPNSLTVHSLAGQGAAVIARAGNAVVALGAPDAKEAGALAASETLLGAADVASRPAKPYPIFLDFYDNRALKAFVHPMSSLGGQGLDSRWPFLKIFGGGTAFLDPSAHFYSPAPGVVQWSPIDYEVRRAEQEGGMVVPGPSGGGEAPFWEYSGYPEHMMKASDTTLLGAWGGVGMSGAHYESWGTPMDARLNLDLGFLRRAMERYRGSPAVGGWYVFAGAPGLEFGFHDRPTQSWDQSADGNISWRNWLRDVQHYSLESIGRAWYGDPGKFTRWEDITVPDANQFFGQLGPDSFRIMEGWRWRAARADEDNAPAIAAPGWIPVEMPPSQTQDLLPSSEASFFSVTFDASAWEARPSSLQQDVWLVFGGDGVGDDATRVSLNGVPLALPEDDDSRDGPFAVRVTGALKTGPNELVVRLKKSRETSNGRLAGPVFLTVHEPKRVPYLGRGLNARYRDFRQWQASAMYDYHRNMLRLVRQRDPDRPLILSGASHQLFDYATALAADYGMAVAYRPGSVVPPVVAGTGARSRILRSRRRIRHGARRRAGPRTQLDDVRRRFVSYILLGHRGLHSA
ncbi:MAG: hypothetical protein WDN46_17935 [Methylocella sp.]